MAKKLDTQINYVDGDISCFYGIEVYKVIDNAFRKGQAAVDIGARFVESNIPFDNYLVNLSTVKRVFVFERDISKERRKELAFRSKYGLVTEECKQELRDYGTEI